MPDHKTKWIELRRLHDPVEAKIIIDFLSDHGIPVQRLGGQTSAMPAIGLTDIRIEVPEEHAEQAVEALQALREGQRENHPFRGGGAEPSPESYQAPVETKKWPFAVGLAILFPIGAGHFYARHGAAGAILATGIVASFFGAMFGVPALLRASLILVLLDAAFAPLAVKRFNARAVAPEGTQRLFAAIAVALAIVVAIALR